MVSTISSWMSSAYTISLKSSASFSFGEIWTSKVLSVFDFFDSWSRVLFADARMRSVMSFRWARMASDFFSNFVRWPRCPLLEAWKRVISYIMVSAQKKWEIPAKKRFNEWRSLIKMATPANTCLSPPRPSRYPLEIQVGVPQGSQ